MKKTVFLCWLFIVGSTLFSGCKSDASDATFPLMADFYNRYVEDSRTFTSNGRITYADSLAMGESDTTNYAINVNGIDLKRLTDSQNRVQYTGHQKMDSPQELIIHIADRKNDIMTITSQIVPVANVAIEGRLNLEQGGKITWEGASLSDQESLIVMITDELGQSASMTIQGPMTNRALNVNASQLEGLKKGEGEYYLVRTGTEQIVKNHVDIQLRNEYFTRTKSVTIE